MKYAHHEQLKRYIIDNWTRLSSEKNLCVTGVWVEIWTRVYPITKQEYAHSTMMVGHRQLMLGEK